MKKKLVTIATGILSVFATTTKSGAQSLNNVAMENAKVIKINSSVFPEAKTAATADLSTVNVKAIRNFKKSYKEASNEKWTRLSDGFTATFTDNGCNNVVYYDKRGNWTGSLKGYDESKLNKDVRNRVKSSYYDYVISYVDEVETAQTAGTPVYIVHIEDENQVKLIRVCDDEMDVYQEFQKQH